MTFDFDKEDMRLFVEAAFKNALERQRQSLQPRLTTNDYNAIATQVKNRFGASHIICRPAEDTDDAVMVEVVFEFGKFSTVVSETVDSQVGDKTQTDRLTELINTVERLTVENRILKDQKKELADLVIKTLSRPNNLTQ